jgi:hypothetical protein
MRLQPKHRHGRILSIRTARFHKCNSGRRLRVSRKNHPARANTACREKSANAKLALLIRENRPGEETPSGAEMARREFQPE